MSINKCTQKVHYDRQVSDNAIPKFHFALHVAWKHVFELV